MFLSRLLNDLPAQAGRLLFAWKAAKAKAISTKTDEDPSEGQRINTASGLKPAHRYRMTIRAARLP